MQIYVRLVSHSAILMAQLFLMFLYLVALVCRAGFSRWGVESILNGQTGERMKSLVFMGPTFYQRLVHMVEDKVKFRNMGPVHLVTQQPVEDKKRFGGVKFGEMERGCMLAYGAAANLHERLFTLSDFSQMHICQACERVANVIMRPAEGGSKMVHGPYCMFCRSAERIVCVNVPYGSKLLYQELFSMGICLKFDSFAWAATVKFGRVKLGEPVFMVDNSDLEQQDLKFKPRHVRLQKMTYASRMNVEMTVQVRMS
jgi:DNA-directed RNA polymerase beta subunit